jgi:hypothetical protein
VTAATPGQALYEAIRDAFPGDDYWPWDSLDADTQARYGQVAAREPQPAPELAEVINTAAQAALARVLSWFAADGTRRDASATRAQLARAYADGGLTVPEELRRFL